MRTLMSKEIKKLPRVITAEKQDNQDGRTVLLFPQISHSVIVF